MTLHLLTQFLIAFPILAVSLTLHEFAHGWVAEQCGDSTAKHSGRLTLNPLAHIDLWGTVLLPIFFILTLNAPFGWAKPVPVNFMNLRRPKEQMVWVAVAGPIANLLLALFFAGLLHVGSVSPTSFLGRLLTLGSFMNLILAVFNIIPLPPLDGSRIVVGLLPASLLPYYRRLESFGFLIVLFLWATGLLSEFLLPIVSLLAKLLGLV
ncbi:MAG: site-2 protease family protein [Candidatus Omnitrophica bacterium]|nr:site-2 protease family protein [Candidatus Omnitrophota bacterium]